MSENTIAAKKPFIVDCADSHWSEHPDFFTKRAPARYKDRVPRVEDVDGTPSWVFDGHVMGRFYASGVVGRDGTKSESARVLEEWTIEDIHAGAYDPKVRLEVLDKFGIDSQLIFPSSIGLGGQDLAFADDDALRQLTIELYNDAQAQIQAESGNRLLPLPLMPAWSVDACVAEARRVAELGARGVNMTSDPQDLGAPDLASEAWDPFWATCTEYRLPVHFHILLAMIVAIVSGQSFAEFLKVRIFDLLGMKHTVAYDQSRPARHRLAHGYWKEKDQFERWDYPMLTVGDGGLFSTLDDLFLWDQALNTERLVPKTALERAFTSGTTNDGRPVNYGFGWYTNVLAFVSTAERAQLLALGGDLRHVAHGGGCVAYFNYIIRFLDMRRTILVLTNGGPIAPALGPHRGGIPGPRVRAHQVVEILFGG